MGRLKRTGSMVAGDREAQSIALTIGGIARAARTRQRLRIVDDASRVGLSTGRLSELERGEGADTPLRTWVRLGIALGRPLAVTLTEPVGRERLADAGHLDMQEWLLVLGRRLAWQTAGWEVATRPADPRRSVDVLALIRTTLVVFECWNTIRDLGAAVRATNRKTAEANDLAVSLGAQRVGACWLVRPTAANRAIVRTYPEAIRARFASSRAWAEVFARRGLEPPRQLGFVWLDPRSGAWALRVRG